MRTRRLFVAAVIGLLPFLFAGCDLAAESAAAEGTFDRTLMVSGPVDLTVKAGSGSISIQPGSSSTAVRVVGHIRARGALLSGISAAEQVRQLEAMPPISQQGNTIRIGDDLERVVQRNVAISYEIVLPADAQIQSTTGSGDLTIGAFTGTVSASTGSGGIRVGSTGGFVRTTTGSGDVEIVGAGGGLEARSGSGDIRAGTVRGRATVRTGSGDIDVTENGDGPVEASTGSGGVVARMPSSTGFNVDARSGSGSIKIVRPLTVQGTVSRNSLRGTVGNGGAMVAVSTGSGDIRID
jgi:hypothetical protein